MILQKELLTSAPHLSDWDYEWYASSGELPGWMNVVGSIPYEFINDDLYIPKPSTANGRRFNLTDYVDFTKDISIEIVAKMSDAYGAYDSQNQGVVVYLSNGEVVRSCVLRQNMVGYRPLTGVGISIINSNTHTPNDNYMQMNFLFESNGTNSLTVDESQILSHTNDISSTAANSLNIGFYYGNFWIKSIKVKKV